MNKIKKRIKKLLKVLGPGFITGAADDDPSGIAVYTQSGAQFGYSQLWTALFNFPFMAVIQEICGRIGLVTGKGLAGVIKSYYSRIFLTLAVLLLLVANVINIGADLGAMAASGQLLVHIPFIFWLISVTVITLLMEVFISYQTYARYLKYLALVFFAYVIVTFIVRQNWNNVLFSTFVPHISLNKDFLLSLVAIFGTTISPYLFFWQASEEVEEEVSQHKIQSMGRGVPKINYRDFRNLKIDTWVGMLFSNVICFFICVAAASTLGVHGITSVQTPAEAAQALRPLAGNFAFFLFTLGIVGSGLLAVPVLAGSASYALTECFSWREGLYRKFTKAHGFYGVITIATLIGLLINFTSINPFRMLIYAAAINAILAPPLMIFILLIANNKKIMGKHTNSLISNSLGILITVLMITAAVALFVYW